MTIEKERKMTVMYSDSETPLMDSNDLQKAYDGSYYFIDGCGGDLREWVKGYEDLLAEKEIGKPVRWYRTTGAAINLFATNQKGSIKSNDLYPDDLSCLLFPLDGLQVGALAIFKLQMGNRWFDDVVQNMRTR